MSDFIEIKANKKSLAHRKPLFGVGINDACYMVSLVIDGSCTKCPYYEKWQGMLQRCYDPKLHAKYPTYKDCYVCDEWLVFSNFKAWMEGQVWQGLELDKDIKFQGNKLYSPETCKFVPKWINTLLCNQKLNRGEFPQGVYFNKQVKKYIAKITLHGARKHIGCYDTPELASNAYNKVKYKIIHEAAHKQNDHEIRDGLLKYVII